MPPTTLGCDRVTPEEPEMRIGTAERTAALDRLGVQLADGYLDLDEFDERTARAATARTRGELAVLFSDLPETSSADADITATPREQGAQTDPAVAELESKMAKKKRLDAITLVLWLATLGVFLLLNNRFNIDLAWIVFPAAGVLNIAMYSAAGMSWKDLETLDDIETQRDEERAKRLRIADERRRELEG